MSENMGMTRQRQKAGVEDLVWVVEFVPTLRRGDGSSSMLCTSSVRSTVRLTSVCCDEYTKSSLWHFFWTR